jgi:hypothetical protein
MMIIKDPILKTQIMTRVAHGLMAIQSTTLGGGQIYNLISQAPLGTLLSTPLMVGVGLKKLLMKN